MRGELDWHEDNISVVLLDTKTGERLADNRHTCWWWAEGNGNCDCNRELMFDPEIEFDNICCGQRRYLIVAAEGEDLAEFNHGYPADLVREHCNIPPAHWGEGGRSDGSRYFTHAELSRP